MHFGDASYLQAVCQCRGTWALSVPLKVEHNSISVSGTTNYAIWKLEFLDFNRFDPETFMYTYLSLDKIQSESSARTSAIQLAGFLIHNVVIQTTLS